MKVIFFVGTAGSGKSAMTVGTRDWLRSRGANALTANLDPGAERLPYVPDIDVREYVQLNEVMDRYGLGPNGAIIVSCDLVAEDFGEILKEIEDYSPDYLLVDTPGQLELFVFRASGSFIVSALGKEQTIAAFLVDPFLAQTPSSFVSILLLSLTTELKLSVPTVKVLSKADILTTEQLENIDRWTFEPGALQDALLSETGLSRSLASRICSVLSESEESFRLLQVSSKEERGFEDLYTEIQMAYEGGDDFIVPEP